MRHIIPISGKDSLATAIWQTALDPSLPYEFVFNDTRAELPDTYEWLDRVERVLGIEITRIGKNLEQVIEEHGILPSPRTRFCTTDAKIRPMNRFIGKDVATVYFGLRSDEPDRVGAMETTKLIPKYPLREAGIGLATVYRLVESRGLLPPNFFWKRLFDEVKRQTWCPSVCDAWPQWIRDRLFAWRSRPNCFFCFFQRRYEWVGLLEHHPSLFAKAEEIEARVGNGPDCRREGGGSVDRRRLPTLTHPRQRRRHLPAPGGRHLQTHQRRAADDTVRGQSRRDGHRGHILRTLMRKMTDTAKQEEVA